MIPSFAIEGFLKTYPLNSYDKEMIEGLLKKETDRVKKMAILRENLRGRCRSYLIPMFEPSEYLGFDSVASDRPNFVQIRWSDKNKEKHIEEVPYSRILDWIEKDMQEREEKQLDLFDLI